MAEAAAAAAPATNRDYLMEFSDSIAPLPAELKKNLALLGELDGKLKGARPAPFAHPFPLLTPTAASPRLADSFGDIGQRASKMMRRPKSTRSSESQRAQWEQTSKERQECVDISEEKVALAEQTYELVDGHVRRLDETLRQFEAELRQADPSRLADLKLAAVQPDPFAAAGLQNGRKRCEAGPGSGGSDGGDGRVGGLGVHGVLTGWAWRAGAHANFSTATCRLTTTSRGIAPASRSRSARWLPATMTTYAPPAPARHPRFLTAAGVAVPVRVVPLQLRWIDGAAPRRMDVRHV